MPKFLSTDTVVQDFQTPAMPSHGCFGFKTVLCYLCKNIKSLSAESSTNEVQSDRVLSQDKDLVCHYLVFNQYCKEGTKSLTSAPVEAVMVAQHRLVSRSGWVPLNATFQPLVGTRDPAIPEGYPREDAGIAHPYQACWQQDAPGATRQINSL